MPQILAVDASTEVCSVAVNQTQSSISRFCNTPKSHSKVLLPLIDEVLKEASLEISELDALAVTCGPGSFTGIRIGMGVIQGLSYAVGLPIVDINTLEAMAAYYQLAKPDASHVITVLDARMGEIYWAVYACSDGQQHVVSEAQVSSPSHLIEWLKLQTNDALFVGVGHGWAVPELQRETSLLRNLSYVDSSFKPHADGVLAVAEIRCQKGLDQFPVGAIEPVYLRNEITWQKRQRIRESYQ